MDKQDIKQISLARYAAKIAWAKEQPPDERWNEGNMKKAINLGVRGKDCPYCLIYNNSVDECVDLCPLSNPAKQHPYNCCNGLWSKMRKRRTWRSWVEWAEKIYKYIEQHG